MMDDERIERALHRGPPNDPPFESSGRWLESIDAGAAARLGVKRRPLINTFAALAAVAAVLLIGAVIAGPILQLRQMGVGGLVAEVERRGALRVALDGGPPQAFSPGSGYDGFDIDVAREVAARLGVRMELVVVPRDEILGAESGGNWDVAISSVADGQPLGASTLTTDPYAVIAGAVLVRSDDPASTLNDLDGATLCVVSGSTAEAWVAGSLRMDGDLVTPPPLGADVVARSTVQECIDATADENVRAVVVDRRTDVPASGSVRFLPSAPFESRLVAVVDERAEGAATLVARLNQLFAEMASDGTIREFGQRRFAGDDVTPAAD
jgi:polar amino acid transport system substrate-binding protein